MIYSSPAACHITATPNRICVCHTAQYPIKCIHSFHLIGSCRIFWARTTMNMDRGRYDNSINDVYNQNLRRPDTRNFNFD